MTAPPVQVRAPETPPGWVEASAEVAPPPIGSGSGAIFTQWSAKRAPSAGGAGETFLVGCAATPIPGWVEDMRPTVDYRTVSLMNAATERVVGVPVEARDATGPTGQFALRAVGATEGSPDVGIGRTFVGFTEHEVVTCFATCAVTPPGSARKAACDAAVSAARLEGSNGPPPAGVVLGAATWAVHHPSTTVVWAGIAAIAVGTMAVAFRRRPRSRI
jgi:hypothetical protein